MALKRIVGWDVPRSAGRRARRAGQRAGRAGQGGDEGGPRRDHGRLRPPVAQGPGHVLAAAGGRVLADGPERGHRSHDARRPRLRRHPRREGRLQPLAQEAGEAFLLVFNSQTGQWGTQHDPAKDVASVTMTKSPLPAPVETFTIGLAPAPEGRDPGAELGRHEAARALRASRSSRGMDPCDASACRAPRPRSGRVRGGRARAAGASRPATSTASVAPCTDFYEFANGAWRAAEPDPARRWRAGAAAGRPARSSRTS